MAVICGDLGILEDFVGDLGGGIGLFAKACHNIRLLLKKKKGGGGIRWVLAAEFFELPFLLSFYICQL